MESRRYFVSVPVEVHKTTCFTAIDKEIIRLGERVSSTLYLGQHLERVCVDAVEMKMRSLIGKQLRFLALPLLYLPTIIWLPTVPHEILNTAFHHERGVHPALPRKSRIVVVSLLLYELDHAYIPHSVPRFFSGKQRWTRKAALRIICPPFLRFEPHITTAKDMNHPYPVIEAAEVTLLYDLRIEPLVEFRSRGKGAENRCPRPHHVPLLEIQKLLPDKLIVRSLFLGQGLFIFNVAPATMASVLS